MIDMLHVTGLHTLYLFVYILILMLFTQDERLYEHVQCLVFDFR